MSPGGRRRTGLAHRWAGRIGVPLFVVLAACEPRSAPTLRVMTFNIAHGGGPAGARPGLPVETYQANIDAVAAVVARENPDLLAIQEADAPSMWSGSFDHVHRLAEKAGLAHLFHGVHFDVGLGKYRIAYGTALLARVEMRKTASHRSNVVQLHTKGFVTAEVTLDGRPLIVTSVHLDSDSADTRRTEAEQIIKVLSATHRPIVLMGDLNSRWNRPDDAVRVLSDRLHLIAYQPERAGLDTYSTGSPRVRIDWILLSRELEFTEYRVLRDAVSDHLAILARVRWK